MNKKFALLLVWVLAMNAEDPEPYRFRVTEGGGSRWNKNMPLKNKRPTQQFKNLSGTFDPYLFYVRDELRQEAMEREYAYQKLDTEEALADSQKRTKEIKELIKQRRSEDGRLQPGRGITLPDAFEDDKLPVNRLLLMGRSGVGKTASVEAIAKESGCRLVEVGHPGGTYQSEGQEILIDNFLDALLWASQTRQRVIVYFDECHQFAEEQTQDPSAKTLLWRMLDKYKKDPRVLFVGSTHKDKKLDHAFKRRWQLIEYDTLTPDELREIVHSKAAQYGFERLSDPVVDKLVKVANLTGAHIDILFTSLVQDLRSRGLNEINSAQLLYMLKQIEKAGRKKEDHPENKITRKEWVLYGGLPASMLVFGYWLNNKSTKPDAPGNPAPTIIIQQQAPQAPQAPYQPGPSVAPVYQPTGPLQSC